MLAMAVTLLPVLALIPEPQVARAANEDKLCIPQHKQLGGDKWETDAFQIDIISRAEIRVTYKETGNCAKPGSLSSKFIHNNGIDFAQFANQTLTLKTLTTASGRDLGYPGGQEDKTLVIYGVGKNGSDAQGDETLIETHNWRGVFKTKADTKDWDTYVNRLPATVDNIFKGAEYVIGIEEDKLKGAATCDGTNNNLHIINEDNDGEGPKWRCDNDSTNETGASISKHLDDKDKENFNIVLKANADGTEINSLLTDDPEFTFRFCQDKVFRNDGCNGKKRIDGLTPDDVKAVGSGTRKVSIKENGEASFDAVFAGTANVAQPAPGVGSNSGSAGDTDDIDIGCAVSINPLTWLICPMIEVMMDLVNTLDASITSKLEIGDKNFDTSCATSPKQDYKGCKGAGFYSAWASLRTIALVLLVIAGLVMVLSQALSFGPFDAYTVKKLLPRIFFAVIMISLSWPLMRWFVGFTDALGHAIRGIIIAPFADGGSTITFSGGAQTVIAGVLIAGGALGVLFSLVLTAALAVLIAFAVLMFREILITLLAILAPIAIAMYILPNTQKFWKLWWESFSKALLMFPIIAAFIASGRVFAKVAATDPSIPTQLFGFVAYFAPYFLLPLAFRLAGGAVASIGGIANDRSRGVFDRLKKGRAQKMATKTERMGRQVVQRRADYQNRLQTMASKDGRSFAGKTALSLASRGIGGYNIQAADSARRAAVGKELNDQIATGRDDEIRALTVNKKWADQYGTENVDKRTNADGIRQYRTLGGAWVDSAAVDAGHARWGKDTYAQQAALSYEMRKASSNEEVSRVAQRYQQTADAWGMTKTQRAGALKGAGFENQGTHLEFKHMNSDGMLNYDDFTKEMYEKKGSYPLANMSAHTINQLSAAYDDASINGNTERMNQLKSISETFVQRGSMPGAMPTGQDGELQPTGAGAFTGERGAQIYSAGAGHVNEEVYNFATKTGVLASPPDRPFPQSGSQQK